MFTIIYPKQSNSMNLQTILKAVAAVVDALVPLVEGGLKPEEQQVLTDLKAVIDTAAQG